jgi:hypothetical protein
MQHSVSQNGNNQNGQMKYKAKCNLESFEDLEVSFSVTDN